MDINVIKKILNNNYGIVTENIELLREGGNCSYVIYDRNHKYFLKIIRQPFLKTALQSLDIQMYLLQNKFPIIPIILSKYGTSYVRADGQAGECIFVLYDYIDGDEPNAEDTEGVGALIGRLHAIMKQYTGLLPVRDKHFFIDGMWK